MQLKTIATDGGRRSSNIEERRDCTIRALALSAGIPYEKAHAIGVEAGRKNKHGFYPEKLLKVAKRHGIQSRKLRYKSITIQRFLKKHPEGRYYVATNRHAFPIINGTIYDMLENRPLQRLEQIYLISNNRLTTLREMASF
jgi:hypothetical protein